MNGKTSFRTGLAALVATSAALTLAACNKAPADAPVTTGTPSSASASASGAVPPGIVLMDSNTAAKSEIGSSANSPKDGSVAIGGVAAHPTMKGSSGTDNAAPTGGDGAASAPLGASTPR